MVLKTFRSCPIESKQNLGGQDTKVYSQTQNHTIIKYRYLFKNESLPGKTPVISSRP